MKIPSKKECFELIRKMEMMSHIIDHSVMVANVAFFLSSHLKHNFPDIDIRLATNAALLHDITKTRSFETNESHSDTGGELLTRLGYPETGSIIRQHVILDDYDHHPFAPGSTVVEHEIVNYSDKRVLHSNIVGLDKRLAYIQSKYGHQEGFKAHIKTAWTNTKALEKKLFIHLDIMPGQLIHHVVKSINRDDYLLN